MAGMLKNDPHGHRFLGVLASSPMAADDFVRARLDTMIDLLHPMAVVSRKMPWTEIEAALAPSLAHRVIVKLREAAGAMPKVRAVQRGDLHALNRRQSRPTRVGPS